MLRKLLLALLVSATPPALAQTPGEGAMLRAQEAGLALMQGKLQQAIGLYGEALKDPALTNERRAGLLNDRGVALWRANQLKAAIEDFNRAVTLYPESASVYNNRGNLLLALNVPQEALKDFNRAVLLAPAYAAAFNNRAQAHLRLGAAELAIADFSRAIELAPQSAPPLAGRGAARAALGRHFAALRDFSRAIGLEAKDPGSYRNRAEAYLAVDNPAEAIEDLSRAIAFDIANPELYVARGRAYLAAKNLPSAIKDLSKVIETTPSAAVYALRGLAHARSSQLEAALSDLSKAIEIDPRHVPAYVNRAWTYRQMEQPETGLRDIERALKLDGGHADAYRVRGELLEALMRVDEAVRDYRQALSLDPRSRESAEGLQRLVGEAPAEQHTPVAEGPDGWRLVKLATGRYAALHVRYPRLTVPVEMGGPGEPRLLEWEERAAPFKGIGVLHYEAARPEDGLVYAAVVDLAASRLVALEPERQGTQASQWSWDDGKLKVVGVDGITNEYTLRESAKPKVVSAAPEQQPRRPRSEGGAGPAWAPWNQDRYYSGERGQRTYQKPKTLFDLLFKN